MVVSSLVTYFVAKKYATAYPLRASFSISSWTAVVLHRPFTPDRRKYLPVSVDIRALAISKPMSGRSTMRSVIRNKWAIAIEYLIKQDDKLSFDLLCMLVVVMPRFVDGVVISSCSALLHQFNKRDALLEKLPASFRKK